MQIRFISLDGYERVRVDKVESEIVRVDDLQNKSHRYYFKESIGLQDGEVYTSRLDLNVEKGVVEKPLKPTFRVATPIYLNGKILGILVLNSFASSALNELLSSTYYSSILTDNSGHIIMHSDSKFNWSNYLPNGNTVYNLLGEEVSKLYSEETYKAETFISKKLNVSFQNRLFLILQVSIDTENWENSVLNDKITKLSILLFSLSVLASIVLYFMMKEIEVSKRLANLDKLTGIYNRRVLDNRFKELMEISIKKATPLSFIIIDVDHFKRVNDTYGHQVGDKVLIELSEILMTNTRNSDTVGRWGGEEFVIIASDTDLNRAISVAERVRFAVESHNFTDAGKVTASIGLTELRGVNDTMEAMVERADSSLYQAKESGRNRVFSL
jgi:diguanylate cyclase (GGDEF)-like protein